MLNKNYDNWLLLELDTCVLEVIEDDGFWLLLEQTLFYVESGGMSSDSGFINDESVLDLKIVNNQIWHKVANKVEGDVHIKIDFKQRFEKVQIHSASHLICGIMNKEYHAKTIAFFTHELTSGIEMAFSSLNEDILNEIEVKCNALIREDLKVEIIYPEMAEASNYVNDEKLAHDELRACIIGDIDYNMCGCIHVPTLRQIQGVKFLSYEKTTRGYRIYFVCGNQLFRHYHLQYNVLLECAHQLAITPLEVSERIEVMQSDIKMLKGEIAQYKQTLIEQLALSEANSSSSLLIKEFDNMDIKMFQAFVSLISKKYQKNLAGVLIINDKCHVIITNNTKMPFKANEVFKEISMKFELKGGGNALMAQGGGIYNKHIINELQNILNRSL